MVSTFPNASIASIEGTGLFSHEEAPADGRNIAAQHTPHSIDGRRRDP
jgi:hypothetical protein